MTPFELIEPTSLKEAISLIDPDDPDVRPIAGGTALMLMMKSGVYRPRRLVSLRKLGEGFTRIGVTPAGDIRIGAMTPLSALEHSPDIARHAPVIARTMPRLSNVRVRNVATVGGALAHGDPHMDLPPVLIALGASVFISGTSGDRTLTVENLLTGYYETALARNELITELLIPAQVSERAVYFKVTAGAVDDWPALGIAVALKVDNGTVKSVRIVVGAATPKAMRLQAAEQVLTGSSGNDAILDEVADTAVNEADIFADMRGSASYKRELLRVYAKRAVRAAMQTGGAP